MVVLLSPLSLLLLLLLTSLSSTTTTTSECLKLPLLHKPPFATLSESLLFDSHRLASLHHSSHTPHIPITSGAPSGSGQYFVSLPLGTPPQPLLLIADTGSDLIWVTCSACRNCSHRPPNSVFLPRHSTTFSAHHCFNSPCQLVPHPKNTTCNLTRLHSPCRYEYSYIDGSLTTGFFSRETTTFNLTSGRQVKHRNLNFGCAFEVSGPSVSGPSFRGAQGVIGLGSGSISLSSQLGRKFGNRFSYCLRDYTLSPPPTSFLLIGGSQRSNLKYTPLQNNPLSPTFYYIRIESVSINGAKLRINPSVWAIDELGNGGTILDSGTTLTFLANPAYTQIITAVKRRITLPSPSVSAPNFDLCINVTGVSRPSLPRLSFKLEGGSVFSPPPRNYFIDVAEGVKCLALQPVTSDSGSSVFGNIIQQGYLFEFDMDRARLGFSRRGCARQ